MTQKNKELLLKDLCARLPYGVKCNVWYGPKSPALNEKDKYTDDILETINPKKGNCTFHNAIGYELGFFPVEHVKPYLRPMSSMTEDEMKTFPYPYYFDWIDTDKKTMCSNDECSPCLDFDEINDVTDYLNAHHFDYRGLIPMGIALEAPEGMYEIQD